ncbi:YebC/PmpR family DNA-binding transcriptional regulator [uncultured Pseudoteredinibacter sp.]|uniref:YebC/PmpR family DNA-binding transcriptional regulator n=1 Tax=uncultured Pseudoteredinibacter sp. TaxID=1641701 RepID=UPI0026313735|nr:YebC/PmpR family DNA-binding transcriptional regulator [uncultured Pseudoteredinibacter sp.]
MPVPINFEIVTWFESYFPLKDSLEKNVFKTESAKLTMDPPIKALLAMDKLQKTMALITMLEGLNDVCSANPNTDFQKIILAL